MNEGKQSSEPKAGWEFHPGDTVAPSASGTATPDKSEESAASTQVDNDPPPPVLRDVSEQAKPPPSAHLDSERVAWTASEYVAHHKSFNWYLALLGGAGAIAALAYVLTKDKISAGSIVLIAIVFAMYASRKPRVMNYQLDSTGMTIGQRRYEFGQFRSFAVLQEGAFSSVVFVPLKRFMPMLTIYYAPKDEKMIVQLISERLPMEAHQLDMIDRFMQKIRF